MNKIEITNCRDCKYCEHNGLIQDEKDIRYVCHHNKMYNSKLQGGRKKWNTIDSIDYWYGLPILAKYNTKSGKQIDIPDWCPRLNEEITEYQKILDKTIFGDTSKIIEDMLKEQEERKKETIKNTTNWFKITCPHCKTSFECCENGYGTHCYDYLTRDGKEIVGSLDTQTLECPICNKYFKDPTIKHDEDC